MIMIRNFVRLGKDSYFCSDEFAGFLCRGRCGILIDFDRVMLTLRILQVESSFCGL